MVTGSVELSRHHATVEWRSDGSFAIKDLASINGAVKFN